VPNRPLSIADNRHSCRDVCLLSWLRVTRVIGIVDVYRLLNKPWWEETYDPGTQKEQGERPRLTGVRIK